MFFLFIIITWGQSQQPQQLNPSISPKNSKKKQDQALQNPSWEENQ